MQLSDRVDQEIDRFVDQGEFLDRENAIEELLTRGISVYEETSGGSDDVPGEDVFTSAVDEQQDPAMRDDPGADDYGF